jgi:Uma2 family endonuclease
MPSELPRALLEIKYEEAAQQYLRSLPLEHFMEANAQGTQREITLESLAVVRARRPDVKVFNEMLLQYSVKGRRRLGQVVPDNMVVLWDGQIDVDTSYNLPLQPAGPFWVLEYVSKSTKRKDYEENFKKYEEELKVPYYLLFYPQIQDLTLYRYRGKKYVTVTANAEGRYAIPELDMEAALLDGWVRYWYQGKLIPLPDELVGQLDQMRQEMENERKRADKEARKARREKRRADEEKRRADEEQNKAREQARRADAEHQARLTAEQETAQLRADLERLRAQRGEGG